jgi:predicted O-methyltransferase YrrM
LAPEGVILLHDSAQIGISGIYGPDRAYECRVKTFVDALKQDPRLQLFDLPFAQGVTLVRKLSAAGNAMISNSAEVFSPAMAAVPAPS